MTQPDYHARPKQEERQRAPSPLDRTPDLAERREIVRHWDNGRSVYEIGTMLRIRYATVERVLGISPQDEATGAQA